MKINKKIFGNKYLILLFGILFIFCFIDFVASQPYYYYNGTEISSSDFYATWDSSKTTTGSSNSTTISLPLVNGGTYNFSVDWGDGATTSVTAYNDIGANHTYAVSKAYNITISGEIIGFRFNNLGDRAKIMKIRQWGNLGLGNNNSYFYGCSNLNITATDAPNLTGITDLSSMFFSASVLSPVDLNSWDVSGVKNMTNMFRSASIFNGNISNWNILNVTIMSSMFRSASRFNQSLDSWNTSNVVLMDSMFNGAIRFNRDINSWDTHNVTKMGNMFNGATAFNQNLTDWNTGKVNDMNSMFYACPVFNGNISTWNTSSVTNMRNMFGTASKFNQSLNNWDVSKVTSFSTMFQLAYDFNGDVSNWNTGKATNMFAMFYASYSFNQDVSNWNTSLVTNMAWMFRSAYDFNQNVSNWNVGKVTNMTVLFAYASTFNQNLENWNVSSVTDMSGMFTQTNLSSQDLTHWDTSKVIRMDDLFLSNDNFNGNISNWNTSKVKDMNGMFFGTAFNGDISNWDVSKVTDMNYMFYHTPFNQNIGNWNTSQVTNFYGMFYQAPDFNQDISNWDTHNVTSMRMMFQEAVSFNQGINNWNVSSVTDMESMFQGATSFNQNLTNWNTGKVTDMHLMFSSASAFNGNISTWDTSSVTNIYSMFRTATSFNQDISNWDTSGINSLSTMFDGATSFNQNLGSWDVSIVTNMGNMFLDTNLSIENYNGILIGWASLPSLQSGVSLGAGNSKYSADAVASRSILTDTWGWTITDGGQYLYPFISIISPTTLFPVSVNNGSNITVTFLTLGLGGTVNITSGVSLNDVYLGGIKSSIINNSFDYSYSEGFENPVFPPTNFVVSGNNVWTRNTSNPLVGTASARSGIINNSQVSKLTLTLDTFPALVEWNWNVSSENGWDSLCFLENSTDCGSASGGVCLGDGTTITINTNSSNRGKAITGEVQEHTSWEITTAGTHTLTWCYAKDPGTVGGTDSGWVDNITLNGISIDQFAYSSGVGWQVNLTVPSGFNGRQDLFLNATYEGEVMNDTELSSVYYDYEVLPILISSPLQGSSVPNVVNTYTLNVTFFLNETSLDSCWYNLSGAKSINNTIIPCVNGNNSFTITFTQFGLMHLYITAKDIFNNLNNSKVDFSILKYTGAESGGPNDVGPVTTTNYSLNLTKAQRTVLCSRINVSFANYSTDYSKYPSSVRDSIRNDLAIALGRGISNSILKYYIENFNTECPEYIATAPAEETPEKEKEPISYTNIFWITMIVIVLILILVIALDYRHYLRYLKQIKEKLPYQNKS